jgi:hypothetical protein
MRKTGRICLLAVLASMCSQAEWTVVYQDDYAGTGIAHLKTPAITDWMAIGFQGAQGGNGVSTAGSDSGPFWAVYDPLMKPHSHCMKIKQEGMQE